MEISKIPNSVNNCDTVLIFSVCLPHIIGQMPVKFQHDILNITSDIAFGTHVAKVKLLACLLP